MRWYIYSNGLYSVPGHASFPFYCLVIPISSVHKTKNFFWTKAWKPRSVLSLFVWIIQMTRLFTGSLILYSCNAEWKVRQPYVMHWLLVTVADILLSVLSTVKWACEDICFLSNHLCSCCPACYEHTQVVTVCSLNSNHSFNFSDESRSASSCLLHASAAPSHL